MDNYDRLRLICENLKIDFENICKRMSTVFSENKLIKLDLSNLGIKILDKNIFSKFPHLIELLLNNNEIKDLHQSIFSFNNKLKYLVINNNRIKKLPIGVFDHLQNLEELDLLNNPLEVLDKNIFNNLRKLEILILEGIKVKELPINIFDALERLESLHLDHTDIILPSGIFDKLYSLEIFSLSISNNNIPKIDWNALEEFYLKTPIIELAYNPDQIVLSDETYNRLETNNMLFYKKYEAILIIENSKFTNN